MEKVEEILTRPKEPKKPRAKKAEAAEVKAAATKLTWIRDPTGSEDARIPLQPVASDR